MITTAPTSARKFLSKSKSVDSPKNNNKLTAICRPLKKNDNSLSSPNVNKDQSVANGKNRFLNALFKKLDTSLGHKALIKNKTTPNSNEDEILLPASKNSPDLDKSLSDHYHEAVDKTKQQIVDSNRAQANELTYRRTRDTPSQQLTIKEASKESKDITASDRSPVFEKSKYSPPPEKSQTEFADKAPTARSVVGTDNNSVVPIVRVAGTTMLRGGLKIKERFVIGLAVAAVLFTFMLVVDIQMDLGLSGKHLVPSHGRIKYAQQEEGPGGVYNRFRNRLLQKHIG